MRARRALRSERYDAALALLEDPIVREDRRARDLRQKVLQGLHERAVRRMDSGHLELARKDLDRLRTMDPELEGTLDLMAELERRQQDAKERKVQKERLQKGFERAFDDGRLNEGRALLQTLEPYLDEAEARSYELRLKERRLAASRALRHVRDALDRDLKGQARESLERARRLCSDSVTFRERLVGLSAAWAKERWDEVQRAMKAGRNLDAAKALADWWENEPETEDLSDARDLLLCVADRLAGEIRRLAESGSFERAFMLACQVPKPVGDVGVLERLKDRLERLDILLRQADEDPRLRLQSLIRLRSETSWESLDQKIAELSEAAGELEAGLGEARDLLLGGKPEEGKAKLEKILHAWPGCEEARALVSGLIDDERERQERLKAARQAMREGKLSDAQRHLLGLLAGGFGADEARSMLRDVERMRAKVQRELAALDARLEAGADPDEIRGMLQRLKQTQQDSAELDGLEARVMHRKARVERERRIHKALERRDSRTCLMALREWIAEGGEGGLRGDDKRGLESVAEEIATVLRSELASGDPAFVCELGTGLGAWEDLLGIDLEGLLTEARDRVEQARRLASEGLELLAARKTHEAEDRLERARELSPSEPLVMRLAHRLRRLEVDRKAVGEALGMVATDRDGAREKLARLGPTPRPLGSMVLDLKERLDRGGDLESGCLLQVEEAGEFLLFTEDRLRVGNATGKYFPQIPVLAKIHGHHATLEREVSFHGGVKDRIVACEEAGLKLNGSAARAGTLSHGDEIILGNVLPFLYLRPSPRSASALLRLERGFECRGVSRILWVKQGGKDGRIFVGRGKEVHVRVPATEPELYIYAPVPGRLTVHFAGSGEIDGKEFRGDAELIPGCQVICGGISFRILPL
ncbi:MAG: hypothetical protein ACE5F1_05375 [Planctomycetota bacterium]